MACPICGGPQRWAGSIARGRLVCVGCRPELAGNEARIMRRYEDEVRAWHRSWCASIRATQPCDCGHSQPSPLPQKTIISRERATYGDAP